MHFDTHEEARKVDRRRVFLSLGADSRQDYVTVPGDFPAQHHGHPPKRNEYFTITVNSSYMAAVQADGILPLTGYQ
jgi:hypothetical protein